MLSVWHQWSIRVIRAIRVRKNYSAKGSQPRFFRAIRVRKNICVISVICVTSMVYSCDIISPCFSPPSLRCTSRIGADNGCKAQWKRLATSPFSCDSCDSCSKKISVPSVLSVWHQWSMDLSCFSSLFVPLRAISGRALSPSEFWYKDTHARAKLQAFLTFFLLLSKFFAEDKQFSSSQKNQKNQIPCFFA